MSHDPSEIILICWFGAQETFLIIINVKNNCSAFCGNLEVFLFYMKIYHIVEFKWVSISNSYWFWEYWPSRSHPWLRIHLLWSSSTVIVAVLYSTAGSVKGFWHSVNAPRNCSEAGLWRVIACFSCASQWQWVENEDSVSLLELT